MKRLVPQIVVGAFLTILVAGCSQAPPSEQNASAVVALSNLPVEVTVKQRSTTIVPGSDNQLVLTIDDITRNQVMASLATQSNEVVLASRSMSPKDAQKFHYGETTYLLTLWQLDNALVGEDQATFTISMPSAETLTEVAKIERLIDAVAGLQDAKFIRNGEAHDASAAADHLRAKWQDSGNEIKTATQFIDHIAAKSSISGEPYLIQMSDGSVVSAGEYLRERLIQIEQTR